MTPAQLNLPAHLQGRQPAGMAARAAEGMGGSLPPHVSIKGNWFTFVDAAGHEAQPVATFDALIVDISDHINKRYYDKPYNPADTGEPPACWSANGFAPSREAVRPQAERCDMCKWNERGSAISKMSGAAIKACRDEKWIALMVPAFNNMIFQFVVTPGSFVAWKNYANMLQNYKVEPNWVTTRFSFQPGVNGQVLFEFTGAYADAPTVALTEQAIAEQKTDAIVGRNDQPRVAALAPPAPQPTLPPPNQFNTGTPPMAAAPATSGFEGQQTQAPFLVAPAPNAGFQPTQQVTQPQQPGGFPSSAAPAVASPSEPPKRRRRTAAEMAAAGAPAQSPAPAAPQGQPGTFAPAAAPQAPFMPQGAPAAAPAPAGNNFGISQGAPVNPEMSAMLSSLFPNKAG